MTLPRISAIWSSSARLTVGAGEGAVYTVTLPPPPCGTKAMERTFTPMVAQSSVEASLMSIETFALCGAEVGGFIEPPLEPPPPHAASTALARPSANNRDLFENIIGFSSNLTIIIFLSNVGALLAPLLQASTAHGDPG